MQNHSGNVAGLTVAVVLGLLTLSGLFYLAPHGDGPREHYKADFEPTEPWSLGAGPLQMGWGTPVTVGHYIRIGPLRVEHWDW